jgi:hypothetical protein
MTRAKRERSLDGLAPLLDAHLVGHDAHAKQLAEALEREKAAFTRLFENWLALLRVPAPQPIELLFVPSPGSGIGGGGANGGAVVVELPEEGTVDATMTTVAHEAIHVLLRPKQEEVRAAADRCGEHLDVTTVGEGLAYATAPGIFAYGAHARTRLEDGAARAPLGTAYRGFYEVALGVRPKLLERLGRDHPDATDFPALLGVICDAWKTRSH